MTTTTLPDQATWTHVLTTLRDGVPDDLPPSDLEVALATGLVVRDGDGLYARTGLTGGTVALPGDDTSGWQVEVRGVERGGDLGGHASRRPSAEIPPDGDLMFLLRRADVDTSGDTLTIKCYTTTGARDCDHWLARTAHLVIANTGGWHVGHAGVQVVGFLVEASHMMPWEEFEGPVVDCGPACGPHPYVESFLPDRHRTDLPRRVVVRLRPPR